jgi:predicted nucleotidyltransferase/uncharacterized protein (DUF433 family)
MDEVPPTVLADLIQSDPQVMEGTPLFAGTRVPVQALLDALEGGWSLEEFVERHPGVRREQIIAMLQEGTRTLLSRSGHPVRGGDTSVARDKREVLRRISGNSARIRELGVRRLALFGSFVRGEQRGGSDVDLLVEFEAGGKTFANFMDLQFLLEGLLGRKVQLVTVDGLSPHVGPHILREAEHVPLAA